MHSLSITDKDDGDSESVGSRLTEPFLDDSAEPETISSGLQVRKLRRTLLISLVTSLVLAITCIALLARLRYSNCAAKFVDEVYSPAESLIRYRNVVFTSGFGHERTAYQGPLSPERNALWDELYGFGISRIPRDSAAKPVNKTVPIPGEPRQYIVQLNVFHQLHCLNMLRKRLYDKTEYPPDHELMGLEHLEHCYDALRQSSMCSVDVTPLPWTWVEEVQESKKVARVAHTCRDFDHVRSWAKENAVAHFDSKTYVRDDLNM